MNRALAMQPDDDLIPGRDDLADFVQPGESEINPDDFIRPDGSYDVTPLNGPDSDAVAAVNAHKRRLREATPISSAFPNHGGDEL